MFTAIGNEMIRPAKKQAFIPLEKEMNLKAVHKLIIEGQVSLTGFTLIEAMIALVIFSIAVTGFILPFASSAMIQQQGCDQTLAVKLACDLLEEIVNTDFDQIVAGYNGYSEEKGQIRTASGAVFSDPVYADFSREAVCEYVYMPPQVNMGAPNFIRITVRVYQNELKLAEISRLKSR
ncbi:MAG: prepilin-type N-terminal cleavage/methylation domain-containing protein [Sedimentisphaerales bacterium]|nr:prepilin-type N-terminal cleavage/methylation domain-containing protein [Sedimentisphaerales bacterium]